jgi:hypothetical protein
LQQKTVARVYILRAWAEIVFEVEIESLKRDIFCMLLGLLLLLLVLLPLYVAQS